MPPWEKYQAQPQADGPWAQFQPAPQQPTERGVLDKLLGVSGPRYQTWPERAIRSVVSAPKDLIDAAGSAPAGSRELSAALVEPATNTAAIATPINPAARAGDWAIPGVVRGANQKAVPPKAPSAEQLREAAESGYTAAREMGVEVSPAAVKDFAATLRGELEKEGIDGVLAPKTFGIIQKLAEPPEGSVATISNLETLRRSFSHAASDFTNKTEQLAAQRAIRALDERLAQLGPQDVLAGPASAASAALADARGNYAAANRSERITGAEERANLNAAVANSGLNTDNQIRQRIADLLKRPKDRRGYSPEEIAALEKAAKGSKGANAARIAGNLMGGGGGLAAALVGGGGAYMTGGPGAAIPLVGYGMRKAGEALTRRSVDKADELVRKRSPLYEQMQPRMTPVSDTQRAAIIRLLMEAQTQQR